MKDRFKKAVEILLSKLEESNLDSTDALKHTQAVLNLAHAEQVIEETKFQIANSDKR